MGASERLSRIFKAYDVRGVVPDALDDEIARAVGGAFFQFVAAEGASQVVVGRDMRASGVELAAAFIEGVGGEGGDVVDLGLASTDLCYFASGRLDAPGAMLTASHNPAAYNGIKLCRAGAAPIGADSGLKTIEALSAARLDGAASSRSPRRRGEVTALDLLGEFADHVRSFVGNVPLARLRIVTDTANGMGGLLVPAIFDGLGVEVDQLYAELDGSFPNHPADPIQPDNLVDLAARVRDTGADVGLAFDGDADRVFLVDEAGVPLSGSLTTAIVAATMLERVPGATVLYNCICSHAVPEVIAERGGVAVRTRVGHSFIKAVMAETGAVFGGEHSGHYYFRENYRADSGSIAAMIVLSAMSRAGVRLSELRRAFERYASSGEINTEVQDPQATIAAVEAVVTEAGARIDHLDGLTAEFGAWWFNLRPSNTEPLLRLNLEAADRARCAERVGEVTGLLDELKTGGTLRQPGVASMAEQWRTQR
jgi:phosphomannomutase